MTLIQTNSVMDKTTNPNTPSRIRLLFILLTCGCVGLAILLGLLGGKMSDLEKSNSDLQRNLDSATKRAKTAAADAEHWRKQAESLMTDIGEARPAAGTTTLGDSNPKRNFHPEEVAALVNSAGMQNIIAAQQGPVLAMAYKDLLDSYKLSPDERDYLQKLLLEKQMVQVTNGMQMMNASLSPEDRAALGQKIGAGMAADDAKIHEFLNSDADFATYQTYSKQESAHMEVGMFEQSMTGANALDPATADTLAGIVADSQKNFPFTVNFYDKTNFGNPAVLTAPTIGKFFDEQAQMQAEVAAKAAQVLTPAQLEVFKQNQAAMRQMTKLQMSNIQQLSNGGQ